MSKYCLKETKEVIIRPRGAIAKDSYLRPWGRRPETTYSLNIGEDGNTLKQDIINTAIA